MKSHGQIPMIPCKNRSKAHGFLVASFYFPTSSVIVSSQNVVPSIFQLESIFSVIQL